MNYAYFGWKNCLKRHVLVHFHSLTVMEALDNFLLQNFLFLFLWVPRLERKFILYSKYIYFLWVKTNCT